MKLADADCRARAGTFLTALFGSEPYRVRWDCTHQLQGRAQVGGTDLVVIAPRDDLHQVLVFTPDDWEDIRRSTLARRGEILNRCAIVDYKRHVRTQLLRD